ncbi:hypothetical protein DN523_21275 [Burkholderia multivorans]|nr:hypothetical protein C6Q10_01190 [Burkholderia multivorans]RAA28956.1 hypothetical protein DN471_10245 [Burkholderia multivorans]RAA31809.1 hypothetical protein DN470_02780 [Burkholderia multivorans]RAA38374.1 hypothetical protein DN465_03880 [Burkholderia multivorans]RAA40305.1 hypothetical protein DN472_23290 [Burkholderia multivorans]
MLQLPDAASRIAAAFRPCPLARRPRKPGLGACDSTACVGYPTPHLPSRTSAFRRHNRQASRKSRT